MMQASVGGRKCIILGDFDANLLGHNSVIACQGFFDNFIDGNYTSLTDAPTRVTQRLNRTWTMSMLILMIISLQVFCKLVQVTIMQHFAVYQIG